jgi:hypothetical protein
VPDHYAAGVVVVVVDDDDDDDDIGRFRYISFYFLFFVHF